MSIKYDLLQEQINALYVALDPHATLAEDEIEKLKGVQALLKYIQSEQDSSNLNIWETDADHAANEPTRFRVKAYMTTELYIDVIAETEGAAVMLAHSADGADFNQITHEGGWSVSDTATEL